MRPAPAAYVGSGGRAAVVASCMAMEVRLAQKLLLLLQGSELPMWRYIDPAGACQGPFESMEMMKWFEGAFLNASLLICGTVGDNTCGLLTRFCMLPGLFRVPSWLCAVATAPTQQLAGVLQSFLGLYARHNPCAGLLQPMSLYRPSCTPQQTTQRFSCPGLCNWAQDKPSHRLDRAVCCRGATCCRPTLQLCCELCLPYTVLLSAVRRQCLAASVAFATRFLP